jgi:hypothetical protein
MTGYLLSVQPLWSAPFAGLPTDLRIDPLIAVAGSVPGTPAFARVGPPADAARRPGTDTEA